MPTRESLEPFQMMISVCFGKDLDKTSHRAVDTGYATL
jgi:hypothetical protein